MGNRFKFNCCTIFLKSFKRVDLNRVDEVEIADLQKIYRLTKSAIIIRKYSCGDIINDMEGAEFIIYL